MPRASLGPRLWFDLSRESFVIRDGSKFLRTGATGWKAAQKRLDEYMKSRPGSKPAAQPITGLVYFLTAEAPGFPIKIGFTTKPGHMRSKAVQTGCPYRLVIIGTFPGGYRDENKLHRQFASQRLEGEWFARNDDLIALIQERTTP
jgi:hypothetical protein